MRIIISFAICTSTVIYMYSTHVFLRSPASHYTYNHFSSLAMYAIVETERYRTERLLPNVSNKNRTPIYSLQDSHPSTKTPPSEASDLAHRANRHADQSPASRTLLYALYYVHPQLAIDPGLRLGSPLSYPPYPNCRYIQADSIHHCHDSEYA